MKALKFITMLAAAAVMLCAARADGQRQELFVPYKDLASVMSPEAKMMLISREDFAKLKEDAARNAGASQSIDRVAVTAAKYDAAIEGRLVRITGELTVRSMSEDTLLLPLTFKGVGITSMQLDGKPAQFALDDDPWKLFLVVSGKGQHVMKLSAVAPLAEHNANMMLAVTLPQSVAATMNISTPGNMDIQSGSPVSNVSYDKKTDVTTAVVTLTPGELVLYLSGNGRQESAKAILLGDMQEIAQIGEADLTLNCLADVLVLHRGMKDISFTLPGGWTVTDVSSANMVKWSLADVNGGQKLTVTMLKPVKGRQTIQIKALMPRKGASWSSPRVSLDGAAFQRGYLCVDVGENLRVRSETVKGAQREDVTLAPVFLRGAGSRLYSCWSDSWNVTLALDEIKLRKTCKASQTFRIDTEHLSLTSLFDITAQGRQLYDLQFTLPPQSGGFELATNPITVNGSTGGFEYNVAEKGNVRTLTIHLAKPVEPEAHAAVCITMQSIPIDWKWQDKLVSRKITLPQILLGDSAISGLLSIVSCMDLAVKVDSIAKDFTAVPVGQMTSLGLASDVQNAYRYVSASTPQAGTLTVSRRTGRVSCNSVGLVTVSPGKLAAKWRLNYNITRASMRELRLMAAKELGRQISITVPGRRMLDEGMILYDKKANAAGYNVWLLKLETPALGNVTVDVSYEQPFGDKGDIPQIRPVAGQADELLAIQASDEIAVNVKSAAVREIDTVDLPPLPGAAGRLIAAYRLAPQDAPKQSAFAITTTVYNQYSIPAAFVLDANLTTLVGADGSQQTQATYRIVNAGMQFLRLALPAKADLWSIRTGDIQTRPQCNNAGEYLVPLKLSAAPQTVTVVYVLPATNSLKDLKVAAISLPGIIVNNVSWRVLPPAGYNISASQTSMQSRDFERPAPAYVSVLQGAAKVMSFSGIVFLPSLNSARELSKRAMRDTNLRSIGMAIELYRSANNNQWPQTLDDLVTAGYLSAGQLVDPNGYRFEYRRPTTRNVSSNYVLVSSAPIDGVVSVLTAGGQVSRLGSVVHGPMCASAATAQQPCAESNEACFGDDESIGETENAAPGSVNVTTPQSQSRLRQAAYSFNNRVEGRYTLPVSLNTSFSGSGIEFTGLGNDKLSVSMTRDSHSKAWFWVAFSAVVLAGILLLKRAWRKKAWFVAGVLCVSTLLAVWLPCMVSAANGAFYCGLLLIPFYVAIAVLRAILKYRGDLRLKRISKLAATGVVLFALCRCASAGDEAKFLIVPYDGNPAKAQDASQILLPYEQYLALWNQAHPSQRIAPQAPVGASLGGVSYDAKLNGKTLELVMTANATTYHAGQQLVTMPFTALAFTSAEFDGKPAQIQTASNVIKLMLPGKSQGRLKLSAATTCTVQGQKGSVEFWLPRLPGSVMTLTLPADMDLSVPTVSAPLSYRKQPSGEVLWTIPIGREQHIKMEWSPKVGSGNADKTLTGGVFNIVCAKPWALVGDSRITYNFTAGQADKFGMLVPADATIVSINGVNIRDFGVMSQKTIGGVKYDLLEIRLQHPVEKSCEMLMSWILPLPKLDTARRIVLPQCADVARESGSVCLAQSGGMELKVDKVTGGRRTNVSDGLDASVTPVAQYAWPYRPFEISVKLSRPMVKADATVNQLVRISDEQVQLFVESTLTAKQGNLFGASFILPAGYEITSVAGPAVEDWYARTTPAGQRLDVNFRKAFQTARLAMVLSKNKPQLADFSVPVAAAVNPDGKPLAKQSGRLAVQLSDSMSAETLSSENLKPVEPWAMSNWLDYGQISTVRFAYQRTSEKFSLHLKIASKPTRISVAEFTAISVRSTSADYTYRLRYTITGSPVDHLSFTLPERYASLTAVDSPEKRSVTSEKLADGRTQWTVWLKNEVTGLLDVTANFALPLDEQTTQLPVPHAQTTAPDGYKAIVAVQNFSRHEISLGEIKNLTAMPVEEQDRELQNYPHNDLLYIFQAYDADWKMSMKFKPAPAAMRIQAVVDLMAMTTVIDPSGQCRYEVNLTLQNRSEQFLRVILPAGLDLWIATVAGQPVKPVVPKSASAGEVLIPLVKTSLTGLPYEVKMYLGGKVVEKLDGLTKLAPPAVKIEGIGVMRTTWSLRLPAGYRYMGMDGNMSPIAGQAEMMSIEIDAKLEQLRRMRKSYENMKGSGLQKEIARKNYERLQSDLKNEFSRTESFVQSNSGKLSEKEESRMKLLIGGQKLQVEEELRQGSADLNKDFAKKADLNDYLNRVSQSNRGVSTVSATAQAAPDFIRQAGEQQLKAIRDELLKDEFPKNRRVFGSGSQTGKQEAPWYILLRYPKDWDEKKKKLHEKLDDQENESMKLTAAGGLESGQAKLNYVSRRQKVEKQLEQAEMMQSNVSAPQTINAPCEIVVDMPEKSTKFQQAKAIRQSETKNISAFYGNAQPAMSAPKPIDRTQSEWAPSVGTTVQATSPAPYVAAGTFSLPMTLPEGELHLDYAMPGSGAVLSIYAVPVNWFSEAWGTFAVLVGLAIFGLLLLCVRRLKRNGLPPARRIVGVVLLAAVVTLFCGTAVLAICVLVAFAIIFLKRRRSERYF